MSKENATKKGEDKSVKKGFLKSEKKAVALKYAEGFDAPIVMAKGKGFLAEQILKSATENNIHVCENAKLVDVLGFSEIGSCVPAETWPILAEIFVVILKK